MRILQVCSAETIGGGERHVADLMRVLVERGHEVHCAVRPASQLPSSLGDLPIHWYHIGLRNALDLLSIRRLRKIIAEQNIEIVHAHLARDYPMVGLATKATSARFFLTRHHFNPIKSNPLYEASINHVTNLIAVSGAVQNALSKAFPHLRERIRVIPNWLDSRTLQRVNRADAREHLGIQAFWAIAIIGQLTPLKRQDFFLEAVSRLTANSAYERADFFIIGEANKADQTYAEKLKRLVQEMRLNGRVHFLGQVHDLPKYLTAFDIVVAPSENEGFSLATIEAMAAGCAVIAADVGGLSEIIEPDQTGVLFSPNNVEMLVQRMSELLFDSSKRNLLGQAAQATALDRYDRGKVVAQIEELYKN
ncbi:MAG: glycosyltransferase family 4 protein [Acidobacteria bacterium]|nr:glycosyltransferase family 4 protein [Acidobacteriota bacterium]